MLRYTRYEAEGGAHVPLSKHLAPPWSPVWHAPWPGPPVVGAVGQTKRSVRAGDQIHCNYSPAKSLSSNDV